MRGRGVVGGFWVGAGWEESGWKGGKGWIRGRRRVGCELVGCGREVGFIFFYRSSEEGGKLVEKGWKTVLMR